MGVRVMRRKLLLLWVMRMGMVLMLEMNVPLLL
jgi:hypothetical protein